MYSLPRGTYALTHVLTKQVPRALYLHDYKSDIFFTSELYEFCIVFVNFGRNMEKRRYMIYTAEELNEMLPIQK